MTLYKYIFVWFGIVLAMASVASAEWKEKVLYSFQGGSKDGSVPAGGVVFDKAGNLYGATTDGGMVYQLAPPVKKGDPWTETVLYVFEGNTSGDGSVPFGGLVIDNSGNLYGTTAYGGTGNCVLLGTFVGCGTVYELSPPPAQKGGAWTETVLYSFPTAKQGYFPSGDLVFDSAGNLYGATQFGGGKGYNNCNKYYGYCGTVFELSPPKTKGGKWTEKTLHRFAGGTDGANPIGGLTFDSKGSIYGTTQFGGSDKGYCGTVGCGTVFKLTPPATEGGGGAWTEEVLDRFNLVNSGAAEPEAGVIFDRRGNLYGTTAGGGNSGSGTVFELTPRSTGKWMERVLYRFGDGNDGTSPRAPIVFDGNGNVYGTALGGAIHGGVVFRLKPPRRGNSWSFAVLYSLQGSPDGHAPESRLIFDKRGNLYSTTQNGGSGQACQGGCGTVFEVFP